MSEVLPSLESSFGKKFDDLAPFCEHAFSNLFKPAKQTSVAHDLAKKEQEKHSDRIVETIADTALEIGAVFLVSRLLAGSSFAPIIIGGAVGMCAPADSLGSRLTHAAVGAAAGAVIKIGSRLEPSKQFRFRMKAETNKYDPLFFQRASTDTAFKGYLPPFIESRLGQSALTDKLSFPARTDVLPTLTLQRGGRSYSTYRIDGLDTDIRISNQYSEKLATAASPYDKFDRVCMPLKPVDELFALPNRSMVRQLWIHSESNSAAGTVPYLGANRIDYYRQKMRIADVTRHEWAHHIDNDTQLRRAYARAAAMEPHIARISDYAEKNALKGNTTEIWAEHMRDGVLADRVARFLAVARDAPLSTYVLNSAFARELESVPIAQRSIYHEAYIARSRHIDEQTLASAQKTLSSFADSGVPLERKTAQELIAALRVADPYRAEQLAGLSNAPTS